MLIVLLRLTVFTGLLVFPTACSQELTELAPTASFSVADLAAQLKSMNPQSKDQIFTALGALTVAQYYELLLANAGTDPVAINGITFPNPRAALVSHRDFYLALDKKTRNVKSLWAHLGLNPAQQSSSTLESEVATMASKPTVRVRSTTTGLNLLYYAAKKQILPQCQGSFDRAQSEFGFSAAALATSINTAESNAADYRASLNPDPVAGSLHEIYKQTFSSAKGKVNVRVYSKFQTELIFNFDDNLWLNQSLSMAVLTGWTKPSRQARAARRELAQYYRACCNAFASTTAARPVRRE